MPSLIDKDLNARLAKIDKIREELKKAEKSAATDIIGILKDLMKNNPVLEAVRWNQYTPHFNDGDECTFNMHEPEFKFNLGSPTKTADDEDGDDGSIDGFYDHYAIDDDFFEARTDILNEKDIKAAKKAVKDINKVFNKLQSMDEQIKDMFGDHMQITVTSTGVETEEYEHD